MPYATAADLKARYPEKDLRELTDENATVIDDDRLDGALADASDRIDGYLIGRYAVPLVKPPRVLTEHACIIAMYRLQSLRPQSVSEVARKDYEDTIRYLEKVGEGKVQLSLAVDDTPAVQTDGPIVVTGTRQFTRDALRGM
jgi:phage gp36-like protein